MLLPTPWSSQGSHILIGAPRTAFPIAEARVVDMGRLAEATTGDPSGTGRGQEAVSDAPRLVNIRLRGFGPGKGNQEQAPKED